MRNQTNIKTVLVTPSMAMDWLKNNTRNRPLSRKHVDLLADEMKQGRWKFNGDTVCFNGSTLLDGQHRLYAVIQSGVAQFMIIVNNLASDVFDTIDAGKKRDASAVLALNGEKHTHTLAAALRFVDDYLNGRVRQRPTHSNTKIEAILGSHPGARESVEFSVKLTGKRLLPGSVMAGCHYLFSRSSPEMADDFFMSLIKGVGLAEGDPIYLLREKLVYNSLSQKKMVRATYSALVIKAWNYHVSGKTVKRLIWSDSKASTEQFPAILRAA